MTDHPDQPDHRDAQDQPGSRPMPERVGDGEGTHGGAGDAAEGGGRPDAEAAGTPSHVHAAGHGGDSHGHPAHLAHHFDTPAQQMESGKLGMWVFLATEILMFGGLFCAYSVYRANNPDIFLFGHQALDTFWGTVNTVVLLASSFTMAWGVRCAQLGQRKLLVGLLLLTILGGGGFMVIKTVEYRNKFTHDLQLGGGNAFYSSQGTLTNPKEAEHSAEYIESHGNAAPSHMGATTGGHGEGQEDAGAAPHSAPDDGVVDENPAENVPGDPEAPASVTDPDATAPVEGYVAGAETASWPPLPAEAELSISKPPAAPPAGIASDVMISGQPKMGFGESFITGVGAVQAEHQGSHYPRFQELRPLDKERVHIFFQIYFLMTGLHGIHVLVGIGLISWLTYYAGGTLTRTFLLPGLVLGVAAYALFLANLIEWPIWLIITAGVLAAVAVVWAVLNRIRTRRDLEGKFGPDYYTPVDIVGLYWHLVDLIWIFLFPLLYLIH